MAVTASIAVTNSAMNSNARVDAVLTIVNGDAVAVNLKSISTWVQTAYSQLHNANTAVPNSGVTQIPAGGSITVPFSEVFFCSVQNVQPEFNFQVGATVYTDSVPTPVVSAVPAVVSITPTQGLIGSVNPGQFPNLPVPGQLRFESNLNSGLEVLLGW